MKPETRLALVTGTALIVGISYIFRPSELEIAKKLRKKSNRNSFNRAIRIYEKSLESKKYSDEEQVRIYTELGRAYHEGIPDKDYQGKKIFGIRPNLNKAIRYYSQSFNLGNLESLFDIATIYHHQLNNINQAKKLYYQIINSKPTKIVYGRNLEYLKGQSRDKLLQINEEAGLISGMWNLNPSNYTPFDNINRIPLSENDHQIEPFQVQNQPIEPFQREIDPFRRERRNIPEPFQGEGVRITRRRRRNIEPIPIQERNDTQNVHDHVLLNTAKQSIKKLKKDTRIGIPVHESLQQIRNEIYKLPRHKMKEAIKALDSMERNTEHISFSNDKDTLTDLLNLVWNRIDSYKDSELKKSAKSNLINELSESVEFGSVVCGTGKFVRVIDSLNKVDPAVNITPKWAINDTMMNKAGLLRKKLEETLNEEDKKAVNSVKPSPEQVIIQKEFDRKLQDTIRKTFKEDYVDTGTMSQDLLNTEINKWIDEI